jgi:DNA primase
VAYQIGTSFIQWKSKTSRPALQSSISPTGCRSRSINKAKPFARFHDDKTPSLQFSKEKNICTCFSSKCDAGSMDIIGLTEKKLMLNTHEAIMQLKEWANHQPTNGKPKAHLNGKSVDPPYPKLFKVFQSNLPKSTKAKDYLKSQGAKSGNRNRLQCHFMASNERMHYFSIEK